MNSKRIVITAFSFSLVCSVAFAQNEQATLLGKSRDAVNQAIKKNYETREAKALEWAKKNNYPIKSTPEDPNQFLLTGFQNSLPYYLTTENENAAISINTRSIQDDSIYSLRGQNLTAGIWDSGIAAYDHQEMDGRVFAGDSLTTAFHATHVGGTIIASGVEPIAKGMAPEANLLSYNFGADLLEIANHPPATNMDAYNTTDTITVSNHSYGRPGGWVNGASYSGNTGVHFVGNIEDGEDLYYGLYDQSAMEWDAFCFTNPYIQPFFSAGNERNNNAPTSGTLFYYYDDNSDMWESANYNPDIHPPADFVTRGGYETIVSNKSAKNLIVVGAIHDAVNAGSREISNGVQTSFSSWGPTDDGRIKPDLVSNGHVLYSSVSGIDGYTNASGTSMASPGATGVGLLLQQFYAENFGGKTMRADALKALMIHTADDLGTPGPDYQNGWGLINARAAVDTLQHLVDEPSDQTMQQIDLTDSNFDYNITFSYDGSSPDIKATLVWIDPPGIASSELNATTPTLVHDLDLRITENTGGTKALVTYEPFVLNGDFPTSAAITGDNVLDNVEQIIITSPSPSAEYTLTVSGKVPFALSSQSACLVLSGQTMVTRFEDWDNFE